MTKSRAIFEEVSGGRAEAPRPPSGGEGRRRNRRVTTLWLTVLAVMVAVMVLVGGLTRLTDSGLSITEWNLATGTLPPMSDAAWEAEFAKYKAIPEYQIQNKGMSLEEFKGIYWWEWGHRLLGRLVGLVWAVGFVWLLARKMIPPGWTGRLALVGGLGGLQGAIGWWMVSSGLTGRMVDVASYRLAIHLGLAFVILGVLIWFILRLRLDEVAAMQARRRRNSAMLAVAGVLLLALFGQILLGALVAGIDAGRGYIDWPKMGGEWLPSEAFWYLPWWSNFFENPALVQFNHRLAGYIAFGAGVCFWVWTRWSAYSRVRRWTDWVILALLAQVVLGIVTVINAAPLSWSILHQAGALALFALVMRAKFEIAYPAEEKIARG
jgi:cytochrome c oxidase assembly protein subunit 15